VVPSFKKAEGQLYLLRTYNYASETNCGHLLVYVRIVYLAICKSVGNC